MLPKVAPDHYTQGIKFSVHSHTADSSHTYETHLLPKFSGVNKAFEPRYKIYHWENRKKVSCQVTWIYGLYDSQNIEIRVIELKCGQSMITFMHCILYQAYTPFYVFRCVIVLHIFISIAISRISVWIDVIFHDVGKLISPLQRVNRQ